MRITEVEIRLCRHPDPGITDRQMPIGGRPKLDFLVVTLLTDEGLAGRAVGFAGRGAEAAGQAARAIARFFVGRDPFARTQLHAEFSLFDRYWHHSPIHTYGPFDVCLWDIACRAAGLPLHRLLGVARDRIPVYVSSLRHDTAEAYAAEAASVASAGFHAFKVHPRGPVSFDLDVYAACRDAVGAGFTLAADPVASYTRAEALHVGRTLERLGYAWFEEPVADVDLASLAYLRRKLDIPIWSTEVLAGDHRGVAQAIRAEAVDAVRADVSWKGGVTAVMKIAALAEAFGMCCELHTGIYHAIDLVNLECACAIANTTYLELLHPLSHFDFAMARPLLVGEDGFATPSTTPGVGFELDWDVIEDCTITVL